MTFTLIYIHVGDDEHRALARQFSRSYHKHPPGIEHYTVIVMQGGVLTEEMNVLFAKLPNCRIIQNDGVGKDIGAYLKISKRLTSDWMVCFGGSTFVRRQGWMARMAEAAQKHGAGLYSPTASYQISPHLNTTGFWCPASLFASSNRVVATRNHRYDFEHGPNAFWKEIAFKRKLPVKMVTWDGEYNWPEWRTGNNIYHRGDQANCLTFFRHSLNYELAAPFYKAEYEKAADTLVDAAFKK